MKRKEMIEIIVQCIPGDEYWGADYDAAERVLTAIEEAGMLPPFSHDVFHKNWNKSNRTESNGNEWDPEDDHPRSGAV